MSGLINMELGDLIEFQRGYDLPKSEFKSGNVPVISSNGILGYHNEIKAKGPGITIGRSGTVGLPHLINQDFFPHNTALFVKDFKNNDVEYIFYLLKSLNLNEYKSGSGVPTMNRNHLHPIRIYATKDLTVQQKIASVLSALDKKIELNNKINDNLEKMAKTLYDYWFVQFDFPDKNGRPYKSSGGKMVYNEALKREIPDRWQPGLLSNLLSLEYGKPLKKEDRSNFGYPVYGSNGVVGYHNKFLIDGPGIVVGRKGSAGEVIRTSESFYPIDTTYFVLDQIGVKSLSFHYQFLIRCNLKTIESSSAVPGLNRNVAHSLISMIPPIDLIKRYNRFADKLFHKHDLTKKQNYVLSSLRDWLLPMLMNGQVKIE